MNVKPSSKAFACSENGQLPLSCSKQLESEQEPWRNDKPGHEGLKSSVASQSEHYFLRFLLPSSGKSLCTIATSTVEA